ncbi:ORFL111W [Human betaherpesvirus 5]|nr:ORFL111W [Human betaherpesvirus 5]QHX40432.1 ORFL111W [Human betaherpesvirus 5]
MSWPCTQAELNSILKSGAHMEILADRSEMSCT